MTRTRQYVRRETVIHDRMKNKMATASTSSLRSSIPKKTDVTQGCYSIEFNWMQTGTVRREPENSGPQLV